MSVGAYNHDLAGWSGRVRIETPLSKDEKMKKIALSLAALMTLASVAACNTVEGVGEDVEATGEAVSEASRDVRD